MSRLLRFTVFPVLAALFFPGLALAQADRLDTPNMSVLETSRSSVVLEVTAGASGAPAGFYIEWMTRADFDASGWPVDRSTPGVVWCEFTGAPTLNTTSGTRTFILDAYQSARVEVGDLFDETGMEANDYGELADGSEYVVRVQAIGSADWAPSYYSGTRAFTAMSSGRNCTFTPGYWKTHGPEGCATGGNANEWPVTSLTLGDRLYTDLELCLILNDPAGGNGLIFLAHQLIAAKLNRAQGADIPPEVLQAIADADALIGNLAVPPIGSGFIEPDQASGLTETLDRFNNGKTGPGYCTATAGREASWGAVKIRYR